MARTEIDGFWIKTPLLTDIGPIALSAHSKIRLNPDNPPPVDMRILIGFTVEGHLRISSMATLRFLIEQRYIILEFVE